MSTSQFDVGDVVDYTCDQCDARGVPCVMVGNEPGYESSTAFLCRTCVTKALKLLDDAKAEADAELAALIVEAKKHPMTEDERNEQAASFAFGQVALTKEWHGASQEKLAELRARRVGVWLGARMGSYYTSCPNCGESIGASWDPEVDDEDAKQPFALTLRILSHAAECPSSFECGAAIAFGFVALGTWAKEAAERWRNAEIKADGRVAFGRCGSCSALRTADSLEGHVSGMGTCRACRLRGGHGFLPRGGD